MTIYLPDDLAAGVRAELGDTNVSAVCQAALREELQRVKARAELTAEGFERIEVYDGKNSQHVAFQGRRIGYGDYKDATAYLTPKGAIAVYRAGGRRLCVYDDYGDFAAGGHPEALLASVAHALGEKFVRELDI